MDTKDVYSYILAEELAYKTRRIDVDEAWQWNMHEHVRRSFLMKNSKFFTGSNELGRRPYKNIIRPIVNVAYRSEGFDVKDIEPYVNDPEKYYKSYLIRKRHPYWAQRNGIDTFIDELVQSYVDYGLALVKNVGDVKPEVVPLQRLAFCDQRDVLAGPICERHDYSLDQLDAMRGTWDSAAIDHLIRAWHEETERESGSIRVYELRGTLPTEWLADDEGSEDDSFARQYHIVAYYKGEQGSKVGITLSSGRDAKPRYKALKRDEIFNRACGWGAVEELFEPQIWTNHSLVQIKEMLDVASLMVLQTQDPSFKNNSVASLKKGQIITTTENSPVSQIRIEPVNMQHFRNAIAEWDDSARVTGSASDPMLGLNPVSGTPLGSTQIVTAQGEGMHKYRQGQVASFVAEIYRDWCLGFMVRDMNGGAKFIEELSLDELNDIAKQMATNHVNREVAKHILSDGELTNEQIAAFRDIQMSRYMENGTKKFHEIMKGELSGIEKDVLINVAGKQRDLAGDTTKLSNIFREIIVNPQGFMEAMKIPAVAKTFNKILEFSGLDQVNFGTLPNMGVMAAGQPVAAVGGNPLTQVSGQ
jgi:hypothetical protein